MFKVLIMTLLIGGCAGVGVPSQEIIAEAVETIEANQTVENIYGMSHLELAALILLAGWAIPSPSEMLGSLFKGVSYVFKLFRN